MPNAYVDPWDMLVTTFVFMSRVLPILCLLIGYSLILTRSCDIRVHRAVSQTKKVFAIGVTYCLMSYFFPSSPSVS